MTNECDKESASNVHRAIITNLIEITQYQKVIPITSIIDHTNSRSSFCLQLQLSDPDELTSELVSKL